MRILLVYDIVSDRQRAKVADVCLDYGLDRIQYSAFAGLLNRTYQEELMMRIAAIIGDAPACVHLYPIDDKAWQKRLILEQGMDDLERDDDVPQSADE
ncbi:MAG: CRISPR-associated endonuclease Cas2 [Anaerolineae bacterium]|nr:CRISPR-associated endonuclease Cas2 [Anaerolineae bacterium]